MDTPIGPWRQLTDRVWLTTCQPHSVNVGLVVGDAAALLVDAGNTPDQGRQLLASAREQAGVPVTHVVVTHNHHDHWFGIAGMDGVTSIAHENLVDTEPSAATREAADRLGLAALPTPSITFSMAKSVNLGNLRVELLHFGGGHTRSDIFALVVGQDVIFAGDLLEQGSDPQFDESTNAKNWPTALDGVLGAATERTLFVPGHGDVVDRTFAFIQRAELGMLYGSTEMLIQQGTKLADAADATEWPFSRETLDAALPPLYADFEAKGLKPRTQLPITGI